MTPTPRSTSRRLIFPASGLIALCAFLHACGGGGSSGGGGSPPANPAPPPTTFVSTSQFPANSAVDVPLLPLVLLGFNDNINPGTATNANVFLTQGVAVIPSTVSYVTCTNQVQLVPNAPLTPSLQYTINLASGLQDDDGESITAITYSFTTGAFADAVRPTFTVAGYIGVPNPGTETTEVMLSWNPGDDPGNPAGTISYRVYVSTQPPCFNFATPAGPQTAQGALQAIVTGLSPRTVYSFVVRAVDAQGNESNNTNVVNVSTFTSYIANVYPIVQQFCVACHTPPTGQALNPPTNPIITMDYTTPATVYNSWFNVATSSATGGMLRVDPGNPANSFLYNKINAAVPVAGAQMPLGQAPLSAANQDVIFDWITEGALDN